MADKITVIACEQDGDEYKILLSNGTEERSGVVWAPGDEWHPALIDDGVEQTEVGRLNEQIGKLTDDNAMLQRGLEEANVTIANLTRDLNEAQDNVDRLLKVRHVAPVPDGLIGVTTARVDNLPSLDQLPAHPTMVPPAAPGEPESQDQRDVRLHLERKRNALRGPTTRTAHLSDCAVYNEPAERVGPCDCGYEADLALDEGTKPQE